MLRLHNVQLHGMPILRDGLLGRRDAQHVDGRLRLKPGENLLRLRLGQLQNGQFTANPGTTFVLPRGTIDEVRWMGPTHRIAAAIHPSLFVNALDETACDNDIELTEHWNLIDSHILAVMRAMETDLAEGSPAGRLYGETLANALAVYLLKRYTVRRRASVAYRGGLPGYRLKRVLDYIGDNLSDDLSLSELAGIAGMSAHYFAELFRKSTGHSPRRYVML